MYVDEIKKSHAHRYLAKVLNARQIHETFKVSFSREYLPNE